MKVILYFLNNHVEETSIPDSLHDEETESWPGILTKDGKAFYCTGRKDKGKTLEYDECVTFALPNTEKPFEKAKAIFESDLSWEDKFDQIFNLPRPLDLEWCDPDTTYEEDVTAFFKAWERYELESLV